MKATISIIVLLATASLASAHGMLVIPTVSPTGIRVEVKYDDDTLAVGATVRIVNAAGEELSKGTTNEKGLVDLPRPEKLEGCKAKAEDGMGHARTVELLPPEPGQTTRTVPDEPNRLLSTLGGLAIIALIAVVARYFWPRSSPPAK
jgi:hypothetical protein